MAIDILDSVTNLLLPIEGLCFQPNRVTSAHDGNPYFAWKTASSRGPLISDFVTHEKGFAYNSYGIHVGQTDRLTFFGDGPKIRGYFVDCRDGSKTAKQQVIVDFAPSPFRKIIIPRGVAHSFDNLQGIVTRDEPVWFVDKDNPHWSIDNDLVSVSRTTKLDEFPLVKVNQLELPVSGHFVMSRFQQELLKHPASYQARYRVTVGGDKKYVLIRNAKWADDQAEIEKLMSSSVGIGGVALGKNSYSYTGRRSWTIVPSTSSCVSDVLYLRSAEANRPFLTHVRTDRLLTFLTGEGKFIFVEFFDLRVDSRTFGQTASVAFKSDPRVHLSIPRGVAYQIQNADEIVVRSEGRVFVDSNEPRSDLPAFGQDTVAYARAELAEGPRGLLTPKLACPDTVVQSLAKLEYAN